MNVAMILIMITLICLKGSLLVSMTEAPSHVVDTVSFSIWRSLTLVSCCGLELEESSSSLTEVFTTTPPGRCCLDLRASKC